MTTIAYDLPVKDLIAGLDATGHVTHTQHRKTHVTLHHNGGRLSHEGVLQVWQTRPASAQFDVDAFGDIAQYVRVVEYAWATGDTLGNQTSISIEMCNLALGPYWTVSEVTWRSAARLSGWIFARVIGERPTRDTLVKHKYWSSTDCAGPHIDNVYSEILELAQYHYDVFTGVIVPDKELYLMSGFNGYGMEVISDPINTGGENIPLGSAWLFDVQNVDVDFVDSKQSLADACAKYDVLHMGVSGRFVLNRIKLARAHAARLAS